MGLTHLNTSEALRYLNHHKGQDKDGNNTISSWMLFQPDIKNFPEGDKEWKVPHMDSPQQSTIVKSYSPQNCNIPNTSAPRKKKPPIYKKCKTRSGSWGRQQFLPIRRISEDSWTMRNHHLFQYQEKGFQWYHCRFTTQFKQGKIVCYGHIWLW